MPSTADRLGDRAGTTQAGPWLSNALAPEAVHRMQTSLCRSRRRKWLTKSSRAARRSPARRYRCTSPGSVTGRAALERLAPSSPKAAMSQSTRRRKRGHDLSFVVGRRDRDRPGGRAPGAAARRHPRALRSEIGALPRRSHRPAGSRCRRSSSSRRPRRRGRARCRLVSLLMWTPSWDGQPTRGLTGSSGVSSSRTSVA